MPERKFLCRRSELSDGMEFSFVSSVASHEERRNNNVVGVVSVNFSVVHILAAFLDAFT